MTPSLADLILGLVGLAINAGTAIYNAVTKSRVAPSRPAQKTFPVADAAEKDAEQRITNTKKPAPSGTP